MKEWMRTTILVGPTFVAPFVAAPAAGARGDIHCAFRGTELYESDSASETRASRRGRLQPQPEFLSRATRPAPNPALT
jgi:hypothetical protein